ncbi:LysR family transcriptional regulator [Photobacterium sp. OFAV2-7]|uniref:LysR family transcriptional regulator n=1 Tax=Photobacterium sp. OFAV2-7 TaxID=2917748 RepID=UPI001EF653E4|nr:LysR family transcriptional regulator [Photobacterium sp. OFAV2-7]MCG7586313.1 LysR family transcriptional regulator [Photobacterium sp. OFAV2-7]
MLDLVRVFIQVVDSGSFSKAGQTLNMAPSSVARNIDNLERQLNVTLFKRSTRQLLLTEEGQYFLAGATKVVEETDQLVLSMNALNDEPRGTLRISVFESFGNLCVCPYLPEFLARYPQVKVEIELDNKLVDLNAENIDVAIRIGRPVDSSLNARKLMTNHTLLCAAPAYLTRYGTPQQPEEVSDHNCLLLNHDRQRSYWHFSQKKQHKKIPVQGNLTSKGGSPLLSAAEGGAGLLLLTSWMLTDSLKEGRLVPVLPQWQVMQHEHTSGEIYAIYRGGKYPKPHLRAFIDFLLEKTEQHSQFL